MSGPTGEFGAGVPADDLYNTMVCYPSTLPELRAQSRLSEFREQESAAVLDVPLQILTRAIEKTADDGKLWSLQGRAVLMAAAADERANGLHIPHEKSLLRSETMRQVREAVTPYLGAFLPSRLAQGTATVGELRLARNVVEHADLQLLPLIPASIEGRFIPDPQVTNAIVETAGAFAQRWLRWNSVREAIVPTILSAAIFSRTAAKGSRSVTSSLVMARTNDFLERSERHGIGGSRRLMEAGREARKIRKLGPFQ